MRNIQVQDDSGDRKYFTIIPNYIANHSTANDQALYFQMKKHAGENGECFVSEKTLKKKLGIGGKALKKSIEYLLSHGWIKNNGIREVQTQGGVQKVKSYKVVDIWKMNNKHYEGVSEREPLPKGCLKVTQGVSESNQRGALSSNKEEPYINKNHTNKNQEGFSLFWENYPNKTNKKKSKDLWESKKLDSKLDEILAFIEKAKNTDRWQKGYIKAPDVFLRNENWEDDLSAYGEAKRVEVYKNKSEDLVEKIKQKYEV